MKNYDDELEYFIAQTAKMDVFAAAGQEAYTRYRRFLSDALALLHREPCSSFPQWLAVARAASNGTASSAKITAARAEIARHRLQELGLEKIGVQPTGREDALSTLFMFALEDWPAQPQSQTRTSIAQAIDEFSTIYIEFFGQGRELISILKNCFGVT